MLRVAVTGGIGSGKSALSRLLEAYGATVVDADALARAALAPGTPGARAVAEVFGPSVLSEAGAVDRAALAALVFADAAARERLEAIVHPIVECGLEEAVEAAPEQAVVVYDVPLLAETERERQFDRIVVVTAPVELRIARLLERGLTRDDALARIAAQAHDEQRTALADVVVVNDGSMVDLEAAAAALWVELRAAAADRG